MNLLDDMNLWDAPDDGYGDLFPARLTERTDGADYLAGRHVYDWVEQTFDPYTGVLGDADPARMGTYSEDGHNPAVELNDASIDAGETSPVWVWMRLRGVVNGEALYEFKHQVPTGAGGGGTDCDAVRDCVNNYPASGAATTIDVATTCLVTGVLTIVDGVLNLDTGDGPEPMPGGVTVVIAGRNSSRAVSVPTSWLGGTECTDAAGDCCTPGTVDTECCGPVKNVLTLRPAYFVTYDGDGFCSAATGANIRIQPTNDGSNVTLTYDAGSNAWIGEIAWSFEAYTPIDGDGVTYPDVAAGTITTRFILYNSCPFVLQAIHIASDGGWSNYLPAINANPLHCTASDSVTFDGTPPYHANCTPFKLADGTGGAQSLIGCGCDGGGFPHPHENTCNGNVQFGQVDDA